MPAMQVPLIKKTSAELYQHPISSTFSSYSSRKFFPNASQKDSVCFFLSTVIESDVGFVVEYPEQFRGA